MERGSNLELYIKEEAAQESNFKSNAPLVGRNKVWILGQVAEWIDGPALD